MRIEILAELHDKPATGPQLARLLAVPRERLRYHLEELLKDGSIEVADQQEAGNVTTNIYRVTKLAFNSDEDWRALPPAAKQEECAVILQATWAEVLSSLWAGKFRTDPLVVNVWNPIYLDTEGKRELVAEMTQSWERIETIEGEAASRRADSNEIGARYVAALFGYVRGRNSPPLAQPLEAGIADSSLRSDSAAPSAAPHRNIEEAVTKSIAHRIRIEILAALHEGPATAVALARMVQQPLSLLSHHVRQLLKNGSIEVVGERDVRNFKQPVYSYVKLPLYETEEWGDLLPEERQVVSAVTIRAAMAESLSSLWAGKLHSDPHLILAWKPIILDFQARADLANEQERCWSRVCQIERKARDRLEATDQSGTMHVITLLGFERTRRSPSHTPPSSEIS